MTDGAVGRNFPRTSHANKSEPSGIILCMVLRKLATLPVLIALTLWVAAYGQQTTGTVSFTLDFPGADPSHYEIVIPSDGQGSYTSNGKLDDQSGSAEGAALHFAVSENIRKQVFDLARKSHYFAGKVDSGQKNIANTGTKTLGYKDATRNSQVTYNYSALQPITQLTSIFQNLSTTMEFGRRLVYLHKYQKLAIDDQLKRMEELQRENSLGDVGSIAPVLKDIANDSSVMNVSRSRALRLLASAGK